MLKEINEKLFWSRVNIGNDDDCWNWLAGPYNDRYGLFAVNGINYGAHVIAYILNRGEISNGMFVCHKCDNKRCCNPDHLFLGTNSDNMKDMYKKGKGADNSCESNGRHILTNQNVLEIVELYKNEKISCKKIAEHYYISEGAVWKILAGRNWTRLTGIKKHNLIRNR